VSVGSAQATDRVVKEIQQFGLVRNFLDTFAGITVFDLEDVREDKSVMCCSKYILTVG